MEACLHGPEDVMTGPRQSQSAIPAQLLPNYVAQGESLYLCESISSSVN